LPILYNTCMVAVGHSLKLWEQKSNLCSRGPINIKSMACNSHVKTMSLPSCEL